MFHKYKLPNSPLKSKRGFVTFHMWRAFLSDVERLDENLQNPNSFDVVQVWSSCAGPHLVLDGRAAGRTRRWDAPLDAPPLDALITDAFAVISHCVATRCRMIGFAHFSLCFSKIATSRRPLCDSGATWSGNAPSAQRGPREKRPNVAARPPSLRSHLQQRVEALELNYYLN